VDVLTLRPTVRRDRRQKRQGPHVVVVVFTFRSAFRFIIIFGRTGDRRRLGRLLYRLGLVRRRRGSQLGVPGVDHLFHFFAIFRRQQL